MDRSRLEWKVGLFVVICLVFAAGLIMRFSKGPIFARTYELSLVTSNVGGIRVGASVLMAGVPVGTVRSIDLEEGGRRVIMHAAIESQFIIYEGARFTIEQAGFLGDQYVAVTPGPNQERTLVPGESVMVEEPFNIQEAARTAAGLMERLDQTVTKLNVAVGRIDQTVLSEQTLTNFSAVVVNFRNASERALSTLAGIDHLVETNTPPLIGTVSNLVLFSEQLNRVSEELQLAVATNRIEITAAIKNIESSTLQVNKLLSDIEAGRGLVGSLLKDDHIGEQFRGTVGHLNVLSSNLSTHGLLWRPRFQRPDPSQIYPGRDPTR
jgi:phospholipid/cholesterol/gamma-HCH transport system substrate-binding protein